MSQHYSAPQRTTTPPAASAMVDRERAQTFAQALRIVLQRQHYYVPLTGTYLLPQLYERVRAVDGQSIHINTLRAYLRGDTLPSDGKVRLLADALGIPRGMLLYTAGYLVAEDLPHYPGPYASLENIEADMREVEALPLMPETKVRILRDLRSSARILMLLASERAPVGYATKPHERERLVASLIELWETPAPPPFTSSEEVMDVSRQTAPPVVLREQPRTAIPAAAPARTEASANQPQRAPTTARSP